VKKNIVQKKIWSFSLLIALFFGCKETDSQHNSDEKPLPQPAIISYSVTGSYPHDTGSFTQGLEFHKNILFESTGNPENVPNNGAWIGKTNLLTGASEKKVLLSADYFGEGITIFQEKIYRLTWQNQKAFVYRISDFSKVQEFIYQGEGWGLTNDGTHLIMSNGSNILSYRDPQTFREVKQISVHDHTGMKNNLNELEFINGYVFANVWQTNQIIKIDTASGLVTGILDLSDIIRQDPSLSTPPSDVLNGIAWDSSAQKMYVTGKKWPKLFELKLQ
jgi:glutamine cyclotransferase